MSTEQSQIETLENKRKKHSLKLKETTKKIKAAKRKLASKAKKEEADFEAVVVKALGYGMLSTNQKESTFRYMLNSGKLPEKHIEKAMIKYRDKYQPKPNPVEKVSP